MTGHDSPEARRRAIELLEANHAFPEDFSVSVIARNDDAVGEAVLAAAADGLAVAAGRGRARAPPVGARQVRQSPPEGARAPARRRCWCSSRGCARSTA